MKFGIIFGGNSYEHEISIVSAIVVKNIIKDPVEFIFCSMDREFYYIQPNNMRANFFSSQSYKRCKKLELSNKGFYFNTILSKKRLDVDIIINLIHGQDGEDGKIPAILDFYNISYIGPRIEASAVSYNKKLTKIYANSVNVKTLQYNTIKRDDEFIPKYPCILKPLRLGSSIGISVANNDEEFAYAKDVAFEFDNSVLIEPFIEGIKEFNLAGFKADGKYYFSIIEEPKKDKMLDFKQKYMNFSNENKVSKAEISDELEYKIKDAFMKIYDPLFDGALIRCDFFEFNSEIYLNEINPNPGSLAHYLFDDFNLAINTLVSNLPNANNITNMNYDLINSITSTKGKLN